MFFHRLNDAHFPFSVASPRDVRLTRRIFVRFGAPTSTLWPLTLSKTASLSAPRPVFL